MESLLLFDVMSGTMLQCVAEYRTKHFDPFNGLRLAIGKSGIAVVGAEFAFVIIMNIPVTSPAELVLASKTLGLLNIHRGRE